MTRHPQHHDHEHCADHAAPTHLDERQGRNPNAWRIARVNAASPAADADQSDRVTDTIKPTDSERSPAEATLVSCVVTSAQPAGPGVGQPVERVTTLGGIHDQTEDHHRGDHGGKTEMMTRRRRPLRRERPVAVGLRP